MLSFVGSFSVLVTFERSQKEVLEVAARFSGREFQAERAAGAKALR